MSCNLVDARQIGTFTSGNADIIALIYCDTSADLPAANYFSGFNIFQGSTAEVIDNGAVYRIDSNGVWKPQPASAQIALDLTGYYTSAQTDSAISAAIAIALNNYYDDVTVNSLVDAAAIASLSRGTSIPAGADLDTYTTAGRYYCTSGNSSTVTNKPYAVAVSFQLTVEQNQGSARPLQTITYNTNSSTYIGKVYKRWFDPVTLQFGQWFAFEGVPV